MTPQSLLQSTLDKVSQLVEAAGKITVFQPPETSAQDIEFALTLSGFSDIVSSENEVFFP